MIRNTSPQCSQDELPAVEQDEAKVIRLPELYEDLDLLRSAEVRVEICCIPPDDNLNT